MVLFLFDRVNDFLELGEKVIATEPIEHLGDVSYCDVIRCTMEKRGDLLKSMKLQDGHHFISDVFQITGSTFQSNEKITIKFPASKTALPPSAALKVKVKCGHKWIDIGAEIKVLPQS